VEGRKAYLISMPDGTLQVQITDMAVSDTLIVLIAI